MGLRFSDIEILQYKLSGFDQLTPQSRIFLYYLSEAALVGRDILYAQHHAYALPMRYLLEQVYLRERTDGLSEEGLKLEEYLRCFWFASGFHHHYRESKLIPRFTPEYFASSFDQIPHHIRHKCRTLGLTKEKALSLLFDPKESPIRRASGDKKTLLERSSVNFYGANVTTNEALDYYESLKSSFSPGLNTRLVRDMEGNLSEEIASTEGLYAEALREVCRALSEAKRYAPSKEVSHQLDLLIQYYRTGSLEIYREFNIAWVQATSPSGEDFINGFTETYTDPLGLKGSWEGIVMMRDEIGSLRTQTIASLAGVMESKSPISERFKKGNISGVSASAVQVVMLGGDSYPSSPLGINLPNDEELRAEYGSKSVTLTNIAESIESERSREQLNEEFYLGSDVQQRIFQWGSLADRVHTDLHECIGHGSGRLLPGVSSEALGQFGSTIEEARADLCALYHIADPVWVERGVLPDPEAYKAAYDRYLTNGTLVHLARLNPGDRLTQAHMQDRALISRYCLTHSGAGEIVSLIQREGKSYVRIHDYHRLREVFGQLLAEIQRIKSTGDYEAARQMVEQYGTEVDESLRAEVFQRYEALDIAPFVGFTNPRLTPIRDEEGEILDIRIDYEEDYDTQMLRYSREYAHLLGEKSSPYSTSLSQIRRALVRNMDGVVAESMRRKGAKYPRNYGVHITRLREIAGELEPNAEFATYLYSLDTREMRILATLLMPPEKLSTTEALQWISQSQTPEVAEQLVMNLLSRHPDAEEILLRLLQIHALEENDPLSYIPYLLYARLLVSSDLGYELRSLLLKRASQDLHKESLHLYILRTLTRLAERDHNSHSLVCEWVRSQKLVHPNHPLLLGLEEMICRDDVSEISNEIS